MSSIQPQELSDLNVAFPTSVSHLMPRYDEIPSTFTSWNNPYVKKTSDWFYDGIKFSTLRAKEGIDATKAIRHLKAIMGSWEPKQEHKIAAVAYLMSLWFDLV